ncbi:HNH endonuclease [Arthrobacter bambusae]|uniref:HNH endonuclease n=1 Tax=Arthrobacter bambusae TaxID=1338426 RepID=UPI003558CC50|nr:HNH endonuclease [Arthrobacter bambusae]
MLRRAENVSLTHRPGFWTGKGPVFLTVGRKSYQLKKLTKQEFSERQEGQRRYPSPVVTVHGRKYWQFENKFYWENDGLKAAEIYALIMTRKQRDRQHIERAQATVAMGSTPRNAPARRQIPDDVKLLVWTRDEGRCRNCGSETELQYDHVIPVSMGGSNNPENLQILCGPCNRFKSAGITVNR